MYRRIIKAEKEGDLQIQLPKEYLNKEVEVIAFELNENKVEKKDEINDFSDAMDFFRRMNVDMSDFKFNRDEANER